MGQNTKGDLESQQLRGTSLADQGRSQVPSIIKKCGWIEKDLQDKDTGVFVHQDITDGEER